jgi:hypothetical protein
MGNGGIDPPEDLVFGAKLKCTLSLNPTFLFVDWDRKTINGLPAACVTDREPGVNIPPFGTCQSGTFSSTPCEVQLMELAEKWENLEKQNVSINGEEIITTGSIIVCNFYSGRITPANSGQDGVIAKQWLFLQEMAGKYPGLMELLMNPNSSIYTPIDRHRDVLDLLFNIINFSGPSIFLMSQDGNDLLGPLILACIGNLAPSIGVGNPDSLLSGIENMISRTGVQNGAEPHYLNSRLWYVLLKDSSWYAEKVAEGGFYKWQEENKALAGFLAEAANTAAFMAIAYASMSSRVNPARPNNPKSAGSDKGAGKMPSTRTGLHQDLLNKGYRCNGTSQGGYVTYMHPNGSRVDIRPNGEVIHTQKSWLPDGSRKVTDRYYYDGTKVPNGGHNTGEFVEPIGSGTFLPPKPGQ